MMGNTATVSIPHLQPASSSSRFFISFPEKHYDEGDEDDDDYGNEDDDHDHDDHDHDDHSPFRSLVVFDACFTNASNLT